MNGSNVGPKQRGLDPTSRMKIQVGIDTVVNSK